MSDFTEYNLILRDAVNTDSENLIRLVDDVLKEYGLASSPDNTDSDLKDIAGNYIKNGGMFKVLTEKNGKIIGCTGLYALSNDICELRKMYLRKLFRGKGIGKKLLVLSLREAVKLGFKTIILETASVLNEAIKLYEKFGFTPTEYGHLANRCDQAYKLELRNIQPQIGLS